MPDPLPGKLRLMLFAYFLRVTAACFLLVNLAKPAQAENGLLLKQFSARYGSVTCLTTNQNFRMDASELRIFLKPPFIRVDMYNMASKTRFSCSVDDIGKTIDIHDLTAKEKKAGGREVISPKGKDTLQDYKLNRYLIEHVFAGKSYEPKIDFWTTREKDFPQALETACCKLSGLPSGYGFPVKMYQYVESIARSGKKFNTHFKILDTTRVTRQDFPPTTFVQPQAFRPVLDMMELMVSGVDQSN
jgi:hypothetical protein